MATTFTLTGPTTGNVGTPSSAFTVTPDASFSGVFTPSDGGQGGLFTPASLSWTTSSTAKTFTYAAASTGAKTINGTTSPVLTPPTSITFTAAANSGSTSVVFPSALTATGGLFALACIAELVDDGAVDLATRQFAYDNFNNYNRWASAAEKSGLRSALALA